MQVNRISSGLLRNGRQVLLSRVPRRGKALQGWKTPSIDELGIPNQPWEKVMKARWAKWNQLMVVGVVAFSAVMYWGISTKALYFKRTPYHLMTNDQKPQWNTDGDVKEIIKEAYEKWEDR